MWLLMLIKGGVDVGEAEEELIVEEEEYAMEEKNKDSDVGQYWLCDIIKQF